MNKTFFRYPIYLLLFILVFVSCDNDLEDVEIPVDSQYFVESEFVKSYSKADITTFITLATIFYPEQKEELEKILTSVETGVDVYKITYKTTFKGEELLASGLVSIPDKDGDYPILSYQNGTNTLHENAPSLKPNDNLFKILEMMGSTGFIISFPDYLGFGESDDMFHPYLHKKSTVESVVDMLRAVEEMLEGEENIEFNKNVYLSGYSQGGWATMCLQEAIEKDYSNEFNLKASACGAGPFNLSTINEYVTGLVEYPMPYFFGYILNSYAELGVTTAMDEVLQEPYAGRIADLYDGTKSGSDINAQLTTTMPDFFTPEYLAGWSLDEKFEDLKNMLQENSVAAYNTKVPTLILHGTDDDLVPPMISDNMYDDFIAAGASTDLVTLVPLQGHTHTSGIIPSGLASINWFIGLRNGGQ